MSVTSDLEVLRAAAAGDRAAVDRVVRESMGLVHHFARYYYRRGVDRADLVGAGVVGVLTALQKFDPARGVKFATFAFFWIRAEVRATAMPRLHTKGARRVWCNYKRAAREIQDAGGVVTRDAIAEHLGASLADVEEVLNATSRPLPIDLAPAAVDEERTDAVRAAIETLPPRWRRVLDRRMAGESFAQVAEAIGISRERVKQIEKKAHARLREILAPVVEEGLS